eukprot:TRINITY_DN22439_c0_g1_i3.p1 TRINITY_DN22439_c0_g1~~TRINITY_DN22439_c0_g1_i3.p1  ORF type:complete len:739 (+),score=114.79 TRINITY_DN22439_c0_g1_i3:2117-4333(+)
MSESVFLSALPSAFASLLEQVKYYRVTWAELDDELSDLKHRNRKKRGGQRGRLQPSEEEQELHAKLRETKPKLDELSCRFAQMSSEHFPEHMMLWRKRLGTVDMLVDLDDVVQGLYDEHSKLHHFSLERCLRGRADVVLVSRAADPGDHFVLKKYQHQTSDRERRRFRRVVRALHRLDHPNTQSLLRIFVDEDNGLEVAFAVFEYFPLGDALDWLHYKSPEKRSVQAVLMQTLAGLAHAHSVGVVHGDVKLDNIFLKPADAHPHPIAVLGDFDLCFDETAPTAPTRRTVGGGTLHYMPPEEPGTAVADLFSYGVCLLKTTSGDAAARPMFEDDEPIWHCNVGGGAFTLLKVLLSKEPSCRGGASDALGHSFFDEVRSLQKELECNHARARWCKRTDLVSRLEAQKVALQEAQNREESLAFQNAKLMLEVEARASVPLPEYWFSTVQFRFDGMVGQEYLVEAGEETCKAVQQLFDELTWSDLIGLGMDGNGMSHGSFRVLSVQRNENSIMFERYAACLRSMMRKLLKKQNEKLVDDNREDSLENILTNSAKEPLLRRWLTSLRLDATCNEVLLMHGAPTSGAVAWRRRGSGKKLKWVPPGDGEVVKDSAVQAILKQGFDLRLANDGMLGRGLYFAERPCKSDRYALRYSADPASTSIGETAHIFLCRVALGRAYRTADSNKMRGLTRPPCVQGHDDKTERCEHDRQDSVVFDKEGKYREFVVYNGDQIYPEFLVEYQRC